jgi:heme/copper-type cytochrome/quinol oxidase subunit 2
MTAAFIVGAVVQGTLVYIIFKFREKKVKSR